MKKLIWLFVFLSLFNYADAQNYKTKNGIIRIVSETPLENINAVNKQVYSSLDISSGDFNFNVIMKSFEFEKQLMQEHFNDKYAESGKFPNATFYGKITNILKIDFSKDGTYPALVEGDLTIHGITRKVKEMGIFDVKNGIITGQSIFHIVLQEYNIKIPDDKIYQIAQCVKLNIDIILNK
jgi:hypothetical protein